RRVDRGNQCLKAPGRVIDPLWLIACCLQPEYLCTGVATKEARSRVVQNVPRSPPYATNDPFDQYAGDRLCIRGANDRDATRPFVGGRAVLAPLDDGYAVDLLDIPVRVCRIGTRVLDDRHVLAVIRPCRHVM